MTEVNATQVAQDIFRKVIKAGYYHGFHSECMVKSSEFMCHSLGFAIDDGLITREQYHIAKDEIYDCLERSGTKRIALGSVLRDLKPHLYTPCGNYTEIYWDWATKCPF